MEVERLHTAPLSPRSSPPSPSRTRDKHEERRVTRTLNTAPTAPEIIAAKTEYAKSQRIAVTRSKKEHD